MFCSGSHLRGHHQGGMDHIDRSKMDRSSLFHLVTYLPFHLRALLRLLSTWNQAQIPFPRSSKIADHKKKTPPHTSNKKKTQKTPKNSTPACPRQESNPNRVESPANPDERFVGWSSAGSYSGATHFHSAKVSYLWRDPTVILGLQTRPYMGVPFQEERLLATMMSLYFSPSLV
jgi:hypothetical protein